MVYFHVRNYFRKNKEFSHVSIRETKTDFSSCTRVSTFSPNQDLLEWSLLYCYTCSISEVERHNKQHGAFPTCLCFLVECHFWQVTKRLIVARLTGPYNYINIKIIFNLSFQYCGCAEALWPWAEMTSHSLSYSSSFGEQEFIQ